MKIMDYNEFSAINEKLITFNNKAYPKNDQIVIMCGGGGSGKGFVISNVLGINAKVLNVDDIKETLIKMKRDNPMSKQYYEEFGIYLDEVDMTNPKNVSDLHEFASKNGLAKKQNNLLFEQQATKKVKDNILFDVTLKSYPKLEDIAVLAGMGGYDINNIHLVWVLNSFETAKKQNQLRSRKVADKILQKTHQGCAEQMLNILKYGKGHDIVGGDVWIYFGSTFTGDAKQMVSPNGGKYLSDFCCIKCKSAGKDYRNYEDLMNEKVRVFDTDGNETGKVTLREKINSYIPLENEKF